MKILDLWSKFNQNLDTYSLGPFRELEMQKSNTQNGGPREEDRVGRMRGVVGGRGRFLGLVGWRKNGEAVVEESI